MTHRLDGVLVVDKPVGPTSHDVVALVRRALREKRIGHTGTLDPLASGVLPLVIGRATRLASLLSSSEKEYEAGVRLGASTDTYDAASLPLGASPPSPPAVDRDAVEAALDRFRGPFEQMPPAYSAKKVGGVAAYKLARRQEPAALRAVPVATHTLVLVAYDDGLVTLRMVTTPGFYVRSLAHDLGQLLGCGAYLESLRRTRAGAFDLASAVPLEVIGRDPEAAVAKLVPLEQLAPELPAVRVTPRGATRVAHGNFLAVNDFAEKGSGPVSGAVRVFDEGVRLLAIGRYGPDGVLRPSVVLV